MQGSEPNTREAWTLHALRPESSIPISRRPRGFRLQVSPGPPCSDV